MAVDGLTELYFAAYGTALCQADVAALVRQIGNHDDGRTDELEQLGQLGLRHQWERHTMLQQQIVTESVRFITDRVTW